MSSLWNPFSVGKSVANLEALSGMQIPDPASVEGTVVYVTATSDYYRFILFSFAPVDGYYALKTSYGEDSRWLKMGLNPPGSIPFTWETSSPLLLSMHLTPNIILSDIRIVVIVGFNDPRVQLSMETGAGVSLLSACGEAGQYESHDSFNPPIQDYLYLRIEPFAATQGAGYALYNFRR